jgi:hypothetical protein
MTKYLIKNCANLIGFATTDALNMSLYYQPNKHMNGWVLFYKQVFYIFRNYHLLPQVMR